MKVITDKPFPLLERVIETFPYVKEAGKSVIFAYGGDLYAHEGAVLSVDLMMHEATHCLQQGNEPDVWWERYLTDAPFRLAQEVEAYRVQYKYYCAMYKDRNQRARFLLSIAKTLSSELYGSLCTSTEAMRLIRNG